jgi:hypothetical protein
VYDHVRDFQNFSIFKRSKVEDSGPTFFAQKPLLAFEFGQDSAVNPADASKSGNTRWDRAEDGDESIIRLHHSKYDSQTNTLSFRNDVMVIDNTTSKVTESFSEAHAVRIYTISHVRGLLERCGFQPPAFYEIDLGSRGNPKLASFSTFRVLAVAKPAR